MWQAKADFVLGATRNDDVGTLRLSHMPSQVLLQNDVSLRSRRSMSIPVYRPMRSHYWKLNFPLTSAFASSLLHIARLFLIKS